jgi:hypothetical protein
VGARLVGAQLSRASLQGADLRRCNLSKASLRDCDLRGANLSDALLVDADLYRAEMTAAILGQAGLTRANLSSANLTHAYLERAYLVEANLSRTRLEGAKLGGSVLERSLLLETDLRDADLTACKTYGASVWKVKLEGAKQLDLQITPESETPLSIDSMDAAQIMYLLLDNRKIDQFINTMNKKAVLLLGRFTEGRKEVLDMLRDELRNAQWMPIVFDFERPAGRDLTETITMLARWSRFIIADLTKPRSAPLELQAIVPDLEVPLIPIIQADEQAFAMFRDLGKYGWVAPVVAYTDRNELCAILKSSVIDVGVNMSDAIELAKSRR